MGNDVPVCARIGNALPTNLRSPAVPFSHIAPDFVVELMSPSDRLAKVEEKMDEYLANGCLLGWLIGEWKALSGQDAEIRTTYSWDANKKFIHVRFAVKGKVLSLSGTQIIGVDPATGGIRTWTFEADGGVGVSDWNRDGDHWELSVTGTLADGRRLTETNILRRVNDDTITWQSIRRSLDGTDLADLPPVKVTRIKSDK